VVDEAHVQVGTFSVTEWIETTIHVLALDLQAKTFTCVLVKVMRHIQLGAAMQPIGEQI
jgi:hypothetical protein